MKKLLFFVTFVFIALFSNAQYKHRLGVGLRLGVTMGVDIKKHYESERALEVVLGMRYGRAYEIKGFIEIYKYNLKKIKYLDFFYGPGVHVAYYYKSYSCSNCDLYYRNKFIAGIDGIVGIEYKIPNYPFQITADISPRLDIYSFWDTAFYAGDYIDTGITFKYLIK